MMIKQDNFQTLFFNHNLVAQPRDDVTRLVFSVPETNADIFLPALYLVERHNGFFHYDSLIGYINFLNGKNCFNYVQELHEIQKTLHKLHNFHYIELLAGVEETSIKYLFCYSKKIREFTLDIINGFYEQHINPLGMVCFFDSKKHFSIGVSFKDQSLAIAYKIALSQCFPNSKFY